MTEVCLRQHNTKDGKTRIWKAWTEGDQVHVEHGMDGGKLQHVVDVPGSVGKEGTRSFVDAASQASLVLERLAKKKREQGYVDEGSKSVAELDLQNPLPKNVCFPKPVKTLPIDKLIKDCGEITDMDFCFTRKRDGMMMVLASHGEDLRLYSRRMDDLTEHFPYIVEEARTWFPKNSLVVGEAVSPSENDDFRYVSRVMRSLPEKALELQEEVGKLTFYIFGVYVWGGKEVWRTQTMERMLTRIGMMPEGEHIKQVEIVGVDGLKQLARTIKKEEWEGAVVYLRDGRMPDNAIGFSGKERRPPVCWKYKVALEDDFIVLDWDVGSGKNMTRLGSVLLGKYVGEEVREFGWCGTGFTDQQREDYSDDKIIGRVVQAEYDSITPDGKLRFPKFVRMRPDKGPEECREDG